MNSFQFYKSLIFLECHTSRVRQKGLLFALRMLWTSLTKENQIAPLPLRKWTTNHPGNDKNDRSRDRFFNFFFEITFLKFFWNIF